MAKGTDKKKPPKLTGNTGTAGDSGGGTKKK
jgi:hypothetical protein